ncbi:zinc transporter, ZIP family [Anaerosphaera aminiphila DSM 21120]|uniref:Zinc transporter, ZIP family n=1 Tax=Anaerosphaera aminiphila DSM 21120 TaxID=1120995 RepID=A0A1M5U0N3_9FIRM|nr:ZIP family metal transporter [Anaerosphaera aminiphila]SHH56549.1 zinc transporter, ZIP family [Anaerosphaera aminiphila DSM 21120]
MLDYINPSILIFLGCLIPGLMTGIGALPIFFTRSVSQRLLDVLLGAAAGVMLAATCFSLIMPSIDFGGADLKAVLITSAGIMSGGIFLDFIDKHSPHMHLIDKRVEGGGNTHSLKKIWLFIIAITIHNFPEGMATGVGFGTDNIENGITIAIGIGLQNMPEGLAVALSLVREKYSVKYAFIVALATGLVEPIGAFLGYGLVSVFEPLLGFILAFAGGAMLFVISDEIIPETHSNGYEREATYGIMIGFIIMMILDILLG